MHIKIYFFTEENLKLLFRYYIDSETKQFSNNTNKPNPPNFKWEILSEDEERMKIRVIWDPDLTGHSGSNFFVKYRIKGEREWTVTNPILEEDYVIIDRLVRSQTYEFAVISVDGEQTSDGVVRDICSSKKLLKLIS